MSPRTRATIDDLYRVPENGKAELVNGKIVLMALTGGIPGRAGGEVYISLREYERRTKRGYAFPDNVGFTVDLPHRGSFSPDAAFHPGPLRGGRFLDGAPVFAAEVRSETDYGEKAEQEMAEKRADYFSAGALVVWDVDVLRDRVVSVFRADARDLPAIYKSGEVA
jgi:Uma2 family endonuclease